ncbi:TetR/AcrR family transcriptional regulator [Salinibacterium sp. ZJ70]|uniref:TetR/AcrR family transcriptional regulator n=1 Tax=Salinibacterium sp. ZJ70 TaxID=2708084 RepID=UPI00141DACFA|nr:TetR-like C-terminal domain-containing protein [Salinibacterium sp. ZJ70]
MPRAGLSRDAVVAIAVELLDDDPATPLTLARVAARAGVAVPSLYKHVPSLDALRDAVATVAIMRFTEAVEQAAPSSDGRSAVRSVGRAIRAFATAHPGLYAASQPAPGHESSADYVAAASRAVAALSTALAAGGVPEERRVDAVRILRAATHGFIVLDAAGGFRMPDDVDASYERLLDVTWAGLATLGEHSPE